MINLEEIEYKKMNKRMKDLTGVKTGSLTVIKYLGVTKILNILFGNVNAIVGI